MNEPKKSLRHMLIFSSSCVAISVFLFFLMQVISGQLQKQDIRSIQDNIALVNRCISSIQDLEQHFHAYVNSGEDNFVQLASNDAKTISAIITYHPEIFQKEDQIIIFSHAVDQITEAIRALLLDRIYNNLNKEESFNTIKLAEVGFQFLTQATYSMTASYMDYTSTRIAAINLKYKKYNFIQVGTFLVIMFILIISFIRSVNATRIGFTIIGDAAEKLTDDQWDFDDIPGSDYQEIDLASAAFNKMKKNIRTTMDILCERILLKELLAEKTLEGEKQLRLIQETKFNLLQAQINPHFLFNTLNMITNSVRRGDHNEETADILVATSRLLRSSIEIKEMTIPLERELQLLDNYLLIQKKRNRGRIHFHFEVEENLPSVTIPPFSLQPLVENSIVHGLKDTIEGGLIMISVFNDDENGVIISIRDNGIGMTMETMEKALSGNLESNGLGNVIKRLKFYYHNDDIVLFSKAQEGTSINIHLEQTKNKEERDDDD